jgi:hypothetical protein
LPRFDGVSPPSPAASSDTPDECWHVHYGRYARRDHRDPHSYPHDEYPWGWSCDFFSSNHPRQHADGVAAASIRLAPPILASKRSEADFQAWRDERDWMGWEAALKTNLMESAD